LEPKKDYSRYFNMLFKKQRANMIETEDKPVAETSSLIALDSKADGAKGAFNALLNPGNPALPAIVLFHGRNSNPDGPVVGRLRRSLQTDGYTTLSLENPLPKSGDEFADYVSDLGSENYVFPEAGARAKTAIRELKRRHVKSVVLLGFSMGARLFSAFLSRVEKTALPIRGFIALSLGVNGPGPLNATTTLDKIAVPMIDVSGEADVDVANSALARRAAYDSGVGKSFRQVLIKGKVPHNFLGAETELERTVLEWLRSLPAAE
jgi:dienelactone hydrolase